MIPAPIQTAGLLGTTPSVDDVMSHLKGLTPSIAGVDDDKKKKKPYDPVEEARLLVAKKMKYDDKTAPEIIKSVAQKTGVNPKLLFSSAYVEGLNKAISKPEETENYLKGKKWFNQDFPVSGYDLYGLDTFGGRFDDLVKKGYLPQDFKNRFNAVQMENDRMKKDPKTGKMIPDPQLVTSADFKTNEDALMAKAAILRDSTQSMDDYAKANGIQLDDDARNYFSMAAYNAGEGNARKMLASYNKAKDKKAWLANGDPQWQSVHKNLSPRLKLMAASDELLK